MNTNRQLKGDDSLNEALSSWVVSDSLPARFQEQVWQRIAREESRDHSMVLITIWRLLETVLPRPRVAISYIVAVLALGAVAGSLAAQRTGHQLEAELSLRYFQSVAPYQSHP